VKGKKAYLAKRENIFDKHLFGKRKKKTGKE